MATLALVPTPTLYDSEEGLTAFLDTAELVTSADEAAFLLDFQKALEAAADKRDRVAHRLARLENEAAFAAAEIKRLQDFKRTCEMQQERLESYVTYVIRSQGKDAKGKWRKLEGNTTSMSLRACAASVEVFDGAALPLDYLNATVTLTAAEWNDVLNVMPGLQRVVNLAADKRAIKAALDAGDEVAGAKLVTDKTTLVRK